jgi:DNA invertase Pin-like site-specific DNA recombinase
MLHLTSALIPDSILSMMNTAPNSGSNKAFGYLRVSGKAQIEGDGFARQRDAIANWAAANGVEIVRWFEEKGVSGTIEDRPALGDMMIALGKDVHTVMIEKLDRLGRDIMIQESIVRNIQRRGFTLVSALEPDLCSEDPYRTAMRQMLGVFAQLDRQTIVLRLRAARKRKRLQTGRCEGRKPFGSAKNAEVRAGEQIVLDRIATLRESGMGFDRLAQMLNAEGLKTRTGSPWHTTTVRRIALREVA